MDARSHLLRRSPASNSDGPKVFSAAARAQAGTASLSNPLVFGWLQDGRVPQQAFSAEQMLLADSSGLLATEETAVAPATEGLLEAGQGEEQELDTEKLLLVGCLMSGP